MFSLMLHKLLHKKWMVLCLLLGNILLIAVAACYPMYRVSSFQRMLTDEFDASYEETGKWPTTTTVTYMTLFGGAKIGFGNMEIAADESTEDMGYSVIDRIVKYRLSTQKTLATIIRDEKDEKRITLGAASDFENHIEVIFGRLPSAGLDADGCIETIVSDEAMIAQDILIGDEYIYQNVKLADDTPLKLKIVGIFKAQDIDDLYWNPVKDYLKEEVFTTEDNFKEFFWGEDKENKFSMSASWTYIWDYKKLDISEVSSLIYKMARTDKDTLLGNRIKFAESQKILEDYSQKAKRIEATLLILQVPVLILLCAFLYMIAGQMLQMERNEISLMRSRGASKKQVIRLYFMQSTFLSVCSLVPGIPLATVFCKLLGSATAFLEFAATRNLPIKFTGDIILYAGGAVILSVIMTTIPVISYSRDSIVNVKQGKSREKKSLWKRIYLDFILIAISLYGYYSFSRSQDRMILDVLTGESLDPLLYISFSLFILGMGLFCARIQPLLLKLIFKISKKRLKPSTYASLLGSIRTGGKQEFIILFMIMTVSIGISDTMIARTIVTNAVNNTKHIIGTDIVVKEKWGDNKAMLSRDASLALAYYEPDYGKFSTIDGVTEVTQVLKDTKAKVSSKKLTVTLLGIRPAGYYKVTDMKEGLLPYDYSDYLNVMSTDSQAVLLSENFMTKMGYKLGDVISYENSDGNGAVGYVYGFFNYWPTYRTETYSLNEDGSVDTSDDYMIVANLTYLQKKWGVTPYEVWMKAEDGGKGFYSWLDNQPGMKLTKLLNMSEKEEEIVEDTMFQGTNGILSMSFIVILLLCVVGYLIYWIMSIRSRELLFGVLRAMGMKKTEVNWLLIVEQLCSGFYAIVAGGFIGILSSKMFVPMIQQAYAASEQVLPLELITKAGDMIQLFAVIIGVLALCLIVLGRIVSKMNISNALKLGED